jgi:hypothetical protein
LAVIVDAADRSLGHCILIRYEEGPDSPSLEYADHVNENERVFRELCEGRFSSEERPMIMWNVEGRSVATRQASEILPSNIQPLLEYTDLILDPSALPRTVYLTLLAKLLYLLDDARSMGTITPNLHVILSDSASLDSSIHEVETDDNLSFLQGFSGGINLSSSSDSPRVWFPILGEGREAQLIKIHGRVNPDEICPLLPSPSANPRRGDNLLAEYHGTLFDRFLLEPSNIIYASEDNPFEVYRQLRDAIRHYRSALSELGGSTSVVSILSSKLVSIGALLACHELRSMDYKVAIAHVEAHGYEVSSFEHSPSESVLYSLWLSGEPYA